MRIEGHIDERAPSKVHEADAYVQRRERTDFLRCNGKDGADQQLLDVLGALRRTVERVTPGEADSAYTMPMTASCWMLRS